MAEREIGGAELPPLTEFAKGIVTHGRDSRDLFGWLVEGNGPSRARPDG